jgi:hypothetical protein
VTQQLPCGFDNHRRDSLEIKLGADRLADIIQDRHFARVRR